MLQDALAKVPANNSLVVRQLAGELVVIPWTGEIHQGRQFRFPITRVQDVAGLRKAVKAIGTDVLPLPQFSSRRDEKQYSDELQRFQQKIASMSDKEASRVVKNFKDAGFDPIFFKTHAKTQPEFRLALARVYADSNRMEDVRKALNLCYSLTATPLRVKEEKPEYWEAQVIKMRAYLRGAEIGSKAGENNVKAEAKLMLERAGKSIQSLYSNDSSFGETIRPGTPEEMSELLSRLNALRRPLKMSEVKLRGGSTNGNGK